jgi:hypothetical protein
LKQEAGIRFTTRASVPIVVIANSDIVHGEVGPKVLVDGFGGF